MSQMRRGLSKNSTENKYGR